MFRKTARKYYFSVEGQTEQWYLRWLAAKVNGMPEAKYRVVIDSKVQRNPLKRVKTMNILSETEVTHWVDYESNEEMHVEGFTNTIDLLKRACKLGKHVKYHLGYSNLTFELWMILHKTECNSLFTYGDEYLRLINESYDENFSSLTQYKQEKNFKRCLGKINLTDVVNAVNRSREIMQRNAENSVECRHRGYKYYKVNPSLSVWESIEKILTDCMLIS